MASSTTIEQSEMLPAPPEWELELNRRLPVFGHRNWIVVADAAYPAQSNPGIETIAAEMDHVRVLRTVLERIAAGGRLRASIYTDLELDLVEERDAPGIAAYRRQLHGLLNGASFKQLPHEQIIARLDRCAQMFRVLVIKTDLTLPYTSVFLELDCGYWNAEAEGRLRKAMQA
ncbi:MAG: RbsD/FucU domain-containing protein [Terracidiphilus sp.]